VAGSERSVLKLPANRAGLAPASLTLPARYQTALPPKQVGLEPTTSGHPHNSTNRRSVKRGGGCFAWGNWVYLGMTKAVEEAIAAPNAVRAESRLLGAGEEDATQRSDLGNVTTTCIEHCEGHALPYRLSFQIKVF